jgi:ATP-dependent DNA ligase
MFRRPMLVAEIDELPDGDRHLIEIKRNGWRCIAHIGDGVVTLYSRSGKVLAMVGYINAYLAAHLPPGTILDGEITDLLSGGSEIKRTRSILGRTSAGYTHRPTSEDPPLTYAVFDVLQLAGRDLCATRLGERKRVLGELFAELPATQVVSMVAHEPASQAALEAILADGREGAVIKDLESIYVPGAKGGGAWFKIKPTKTIDALLTGFFAAEPGSDLASWGVGGLCFRVQHPDGRTYEGRAAGMDNRLRREMHEHPERFIGRVVEIAYLTVEDSGALISPAFKGLRDPTDKPASELTASEPESAAKPAAAKRKRASSSGVALGDKGRMRNYAAMKPANLLASRDSLIARAGEAYERCMSGGSGEPERDLERIAELIKEKELG